MTLSGRYFARVTKRTSRLALCVFLALLLLPLLHTASDAQTKAAAKPASKTVAKGGKSAQTTGRPKLIELGAVWCAPCKVLGPIVERAKQTYGKKMDFETLDADKPDGQAFAEKYGTISVPVILILDARGKVSYLHNGLVEEAKLIAEIKKVAP